jgi:nucleotide-binding universal stress UspA family protein
LRVLLAIDGSASADRARDLVAALPWPGESHIRVVAAPRHADAQERYTLDTALDAAERDLARPGRRVERVLLDGRPASAILDEADAFGPDLIVVGSRGHGPIESMLLGSVSAEVVDHARCPVLVVRTTQIDEIVMAEDGSPSARAATDLVAEWPILRGAAVTVLSVAETSLPMAAGMAPGIYDEVLASYAVSTDDARRLADARATVTAERLSGVGLAARAAMREGDAAHEVLEYVRAQGTGLIVMGTRGHTGLARLVLGSVARNVLLHAPCSVLIVRAPVTPSGGARRRIAVARPIDAPEPAAPPIRPWTVGVGH